MNPYRTASTALTVAKEKEEVKAMPRQRPDTNQAWSCANKKGEACPIGPHLQKSKRLSHEPYGFMRAETLSL